MLIANPIYDTVFYDFEPQDELMRLILRQLEKAGGDSELLGQLEREDLAEMELENTFGVMKRQLLQKDLELEQKNKVLEQREKALEEKEKRIQELLSQLKDR